MDIYIYQTDVLCADCAGDVMRDADADPALDALDKETSDHYPQGPYADGGGEADTPQHCGYCSKFLRNPLTADGYAYVAEHADMHRETGAGAVIQQWVAFYGNDCGFDPAVMARITLEAATTQQEA